ncbi:sigma-54-dependent transcriptional regulator [Psychrobacter jeotgali]|uniref:sigma-54-dependent transcriptional regulator n=1 Tax=Psychrobacter jeotgali TaxID=179010 RepID=UPI00191967CB|nr:sigma-54 dependent transcriptional regulator [Psychrobacter jeotgali]
MTATALVVDDEVDLCRLMQITLTKMGIKSDVAYTLAQAQTYWEHNDYDFCLTDLKLPDGSGLDLVKQISDHSNVPVAVITAHGSMDLAIEALKLGAFDFVNKPLELPRLRLLVENALKVIRQDGNSQAATKLTPEQQLLDSRLIGDSAVMQTLKTTILKLARSQAPVFLSGASGTGKEVVARLIHDLSPRRDGSFVPVNCGAIPSELMESEFFGHKKGSFTGAVGDKQGLFQQANGGTLFLDEVADLPLAMQVKLLRAIQEKTVRAIGDTKELPVDIRILSATHKHLEQLVKEGLFRQDLYYRINVIELQLPQLNTRSADIPALAQHFLGLIATEWHLDSTLELTESALQRLQQYEFAGNVRELRNILERAITLADSQIIDSKHLGLNDTAQQELASSTRASEVGTGANAALTQPSNSIATPSEQSNTQIKESQSNLHPYRIPNNPYPTATKASIHKVKKNYNAITNKLKSTSGSTADETLLASMQPVPEHTFDSEHTLNSKPSFEHELPEKGLEAYLQEQEKQLIITALKQTDWNKTQAAELLGTSFRSLRYRMKKLGIDEEQHS